MGLRQQRPLCRLSAENQVILALRIFKDPCLWTNRAGALQRKVLEMQV